MIGVINYGLGNIKAFLNCYKILNIPCIQVSSPSELKSVKGLILPGVGSFDYAIEKINASGLRVTMEELVLKNNIPILGVCVGFQIMAQGSEEGEKNGLGWINGYVKKLIVKNNFPLPHMGWNSIIDYNKNVELFRGLKNPRFYFLHSYHFVPSNLNNALSYSIYQDKFVASAGRDLIFGCQFHPEKSHSDGLTILSNFSNIVQAC